MNLLGFLRARPHHENDFNIDLPGVRFAVNHSLRVCFLYELDTQMPNERYADLEAHLKRRGYFLQIVVAPSGLSQPPPRPAS